MTSGWQMPQAPHAAFSSPAQPSQIAGFHPANPGKSAPSGPARLKTTRKPLATPLRAVLANSIPLPRLTPASPIEFSFFVQVPPKTWVLSTAKPRFLQNSTLGNAFDRKSTDGAPSISAICIGAFRTARGRRLDICPETLPSNAELNKHPQKPPDKKERHHAQ
jgi:hypothetical protein